MKKILALVLALMLALSAAAMADTLTDSGYPIVEGDMVTLEIAGPEPYYPDHDWNDSPFVTEIEMLRERPHPLHALQRRAHGRTR